MERSLKERLIGASVLVMLAVIFIPMVLDNSGEHDSEISGTNIPDRPEGDFSSRVVPIEDEQPQVVTPTPGPEPVIEQVQSDALDEVIPDDEASLAEVEQIVEDLVVEQSPIQEQVIEQAENMNRETVTTPATRKPDVGITAWVVQLGSFGLEENADKLNEQLREKGFTAFVEPLEQSNGTVYRVRVGPELLRSDAVALQQSLQQQVKIEGIVVKYP